MKKCPYCYEDIQDQAIKCKHCGSMLVGDIPSSNLVSENERIGFPLIMAAVLSFLWALVWGTIALLQGVVGIAGDNWEIQCLSVWNAVVVIGYIFIGSGILKRWRSAIDWGIGSNFLNAIWGGYQLFAEKSYVDVFVLPIEISIFILLIMNRPKVLINADSKPKEETEPIEETW